MLTFKSLAINQPKRAVAYRYPVLRSEAVSVECAKCANQYIIETETSRGYVGRWGMTVISKTEVATRDQVESIVCPQCHKRMEFE